MMLVRKCMIISFCAGLAVIAGCGGDSGPEGVPVSGVVTLNGEPLEGADINFLHEKHPVGMITGKEGKYRIPIPVVPGEYKVTISKLKGLENIPEGLAIGTVPGDKNHPETLPPHYSNPQLTKLKFTVPEQGTEFANFDLVTD